MARNETHIDAPPEEVFAVLADPRSYARWVVGSKEIRKADPTWPARDSAFDHTVGIGPLRVKDHTTVEQASPPRRLQMRVKARPLGTARVVMALRPDGAGTHVVMTERPADLLSHIPFNPLTDVLVRVRNAESLRRLKALAERREPVPDGPLPPRGSPVEGSVSAD